MKYLVLFTLAAFIVADLVNFSPASKKINVFDTLKYKYTALDSFRPSWFYLTQFYSNVSGEPILVMPDKLGTIHFTNIRTKETFAKFEFGLTDAHHFLHFVRNGSDYVLLYSFNDGGVLHVFRDGKFLFKNKDAYYYGQDNLYETSYLAIYNDYVIVKAEETPLTLLKFNNDYTSLDLIAQNDPLKASVLPELLNFKAITHNNKDYLYEFDEDKVNFYSIENGQITEVKSLNIPKSSDYIFNSYGLLVVNDVLYITNAKSFFKYNKTEKIFEKIMNAKNKDEIIIAYETVNENTLAIRSTDYLYFLNLNTGILKTITVPESIELAIFDGFLSIVRGHEKENQYILNVDVYDTVTEPHFSFLF
jgi:hypothetical protein